MNEVLIGNAVKFLSDSSVRSSPTEKQLSFLRSKGLNDDEIEESYRRAALPSPLTNTMNSTSSTSALPSYNANYSNPYYNSNNAYGSDQEHLYQLARTSTTARWLLLLAVCASAIAFLARHIPQGLFQKFQKWLSSNSPNTISEERILELNKKIDAIRTLVEGIGKRQSQLESQVIALRYHGNSPFEKPAYAAPPLNGTAEYGDCLDEE